MCLPGTSCFGVYCAITNFNPLCIMIVVSHFSKNLFCSISTEQSHQSVGYNPVIAPVQIRYIASSMLQACPGPWCSEDGSSHVLMLRMISRPDSYLSEMLDIFVERLQHLET